MLQPQLVIAYFIILKIMKPPNYLEDFLAINCIIKSCILFEKESTQSLHLMFSSAVLFQTSNDSYVSVKFIKFTVLHSQS